MALGSDIMMALDECTDYPASHAAARESCEMTVRWARRAMAHFQARTAGNEPRQALFPIVQGSMYADLRHHCATELLSLEAEGYAIGGLSVGEPRALSMEMVEATVPVLPQDRPRYVMGVGMPQELPEYVARGVDMMDCVLPTRNARNGNLFTSAGRVSIKQSRYQDDPRPLDPNCRCYTCRTFSRAYLRHLFQAGEMLFGMLGTLHNLTHYLDIMRKMRESIILGSFPEFLKLVRNLPLEAE
jgi:queuine tRNA-ribosyltransferase